MYKPRYVKPGLKFTARFSSEKYEVRDMGDDIDCTVLVTESQGFKRLKPWSIEHLDTGLISGYFTPIDDKPETFTISVF